MVSVNTESYASSGFSNRGVSFIGKSGSTLAPKLVLELIENV